MAISEASHSIQKKHVENQAKLKLAGYTVPFFKAMKAFYLQYLKYQGTSYPSQADKGIAILENCYTKWL